MTTFTFEVLVSLKPGLSDPVGKAVESERLAQSSATGRQPSMPALGVPVSFAEINTVSVICELALMHDGLVPDVSLGTHFFNDLVELDMLYLAVSPGRPDNVLNEDLLRQQPNQLTSSCNGVRPSVGGWRKQS